MFLGVRSSLVFSGFGLKPPALGFPFCFYSCLKTSPSKPHFYKTSRLKMKSFSTLRDTQRGSQSYMEKRRGRGDLGVTWMRWGGIKRGESKLASNHFLMFTPQSGMLRDVHGIIQRGGEGGSDYWLARSLLFWFHLISLRSPPTSPSLFSSPCNSVNLSGCPSMWRNFSSLT